MSIQIVDSLLVPEGDGVDVKRLFPVQGRMNFDPFVLWDHFDIGPGRGFPEHPHRGFEGISYMFSGGMHHKDNLGNASYVTEGGAQRFTAGSGMAHSEMPAEKGQSNGIQLWVNLSRRLKQIDASYQQVNDGEFPVIPTEGGQAKVLVGEGSPLLLQTEVEYQQLTLAENGCYTLRVKPGYRGIIYAVKGEMEVNQHKVKESQAVFVESESRLEIIARSSLVCMVALGRPHGEPIHQHGPYVD